MIGRRLGDFVLRETIGKGGGGEVFVAEQLTLGREAVVKIVTGISDGARDAFLREVAIASRFDHPFAAHVYGFGSEPDGTLWIAMELVRGTTLHAIIKEQGKLPLHRLVPLVERICEVLQSAHEQGVVHRDIKPHNIMVLSRAGRQLPKLLDFGVARYAGAQAAPSPRVDLPLEVATPDRSRRSFGIMGTPSYMPPEQWNAAANADPRSDIYSLALVVYQALTGQLAFDASKSIFMLAIAHATESLPPLPVALPEHLYAVLARAAAKKPEDRYASAGEFALAFRAAAGVPSDARELPQLDVGLRDNVAAQAPQPIAEAIGLCEAAATPRQLFERIVMARRVLVRYLAVSALACRGRVGPGQAEDTSLVRDLLVALAIGDLDDGQWFTLASELCRPFASRAGAHLIPPLVAFFRDASGTLSAGSASHQRFGEIVSALEQADDAHLTQGLPGLVDVFSQLLRAASFVVDFPLVVRHASNESWMGPRRTLRLSLPATGELAPSHPTLLDGDGAPVVSLFPLCEIVAPSGGMPEELFMLGGAGRLGARMEALPGPFMRQSETVWAWLAAHVFDVAGARASAAGSDKAPYKGLATFTADDADNFFGREREAEALANRLRVAGFLAVVGPSGAGKSSLLLAGVLPLLAKGWRAVVARPGAHPLLALAYHLSAAGLAVGQLPHELFAQVTQALPPDQALLIVIDQFEELMALCQDVALREEFAALLLAFADHPSGRFRVVITLRDDFLIEAQQLSPLRERLSRSLHLVSTPLESDLLRVITEPARRAGYAFDDTALPLQMVREVASYPGALALLSFAASQLWELRDRETRQMRTKAYEALGGVGGALAHHAETVLTGMSDEERSLVREAFRNLVTAQGTRTLLSRRELLQVLGDSAAATGVLEKLVGARLLVTSEDAEGEDRVEIIHEALVVAWPRLVTWHKEDAEIARVRDALRASARQWDERGRPSGLLWRAETLAEYKVWRMRATGRLTAVDEAFGNASLRADARLRRIRQSLTALAFVALAVALGLILNAYRESRQQYLALRQEQARIAVVDMKPMEALAYLDEAIRGGADNPSLRELASFTAYLLGGDTGLIIDHHHHPIYASGVSADEHWLYSLSDGVLALSSLRSPSESFQLKFDDDCESAAFVDRERIAIGCRGGAVRVASIDQHVFVKSFSVGSEMVEEMSKGSGASLLCSVRGEGTSILAVDGGSVTRIGNRVKRSRGAVSPDGKTIVVFHGASVDVANPLHGLWVLREGKVSSIALSGVVTAISFSPDSRTLAIGTDSGTLGVWSLGTRQWKWSRTEHSGRVVQALFSPDGLSLLSGGVDGVHLQTANGEPRWVRKGKEYEGVGTWANASTIVLFAAGGRVLSVDAQSGDTLWQFEGHAPAVGLQAMHAFAVNGGARIISASADGTVREWRGDKRYDTVIPSASRVLDIGVSEKGGALVTKDGVFNVDDNAVSPLWRHPVDANVATILVVSRDRHVALANGRSFYVVSPSGELVLHKELTDQPRNVALSAGGESFAAVVGAALIAGDSRIGSEARLTLPLRDFSYFAFLTAERIALSTQSGRLIVWNWKTQTTEQDEKACSGRANLSASTIGLSVTCDDGKWESWRWAEGKLTLVKTLETDERPTSIEKGTRLRGINDSSEWEAVGADGRLLAKLPLRSGVIVAADSSATAMWYVDAAGRACVFHDPQEVDVLQLSALAKHRGEFMLRDGALVRLR